jgi:hypothetical protein
MADLASLIHLNGGQPAPPVAPTPMPTHQQTMAIYHRLQETRREMKKLLDDPRTGRQNVRPMLLEIGGDMIGKKLFSIAEFMGGINDPRNPFPGSEDPLGQKQWIRRIYDTSTVAQRKLLEHHRAANAPDGTLGEPWSIDDHATHVAGALAHYPAVKHNG